MNSLFSEKWFVSFTCCLWEGFWRML